MRLKYYSAVILLLILAACTKTQDNVQPLPVLDATASLEMSDDSIPQACIDKTLDFTDTSQLSTNAVLLKGTTWTNGKILKVYFINGDAFYKDKVMKFAKAWSAYANIGFVVTTNRAKSDIRVGFKVDGDAGSWSYIGNQATYLSHLPAAEIKVNGDQTVNFGWFTKKTSDAEFSRVITHEFGHAIGLVHEQSSPVASIKWNKAAVYKYYAAPPNKWTKVKVDDNIFYKYSKTQTQYTKFDAKSIMEYPIDAKFTTNHVAIGYNYYLSATDKSFIATVYPKKKTNN